jgi:biopolymer transport protein ExbD
VSAASAAAAPERSAEPNITPLIDVMLVLLIISMLLAVPSRGLDVALPRPAAPGGTPPTAPPPLVIAVHADDVALDGRHLPSLAALETEIRDRLSVRADRTVFVRAVEPVSYARVVEAIDAARGAGADRIGLLGAASPRPRDPAVQAP